VPDARPVDEQDADRIRAALAGVTDAQAQLERAVADALLHGASVRAVAELGVSPNTVQKYGRAHGWPTEVNRSRFNETRRGPLRSGAAPTSGCSTGRGLTTGAPV
jgi:uncharacterized protein YjcR